MARKPNYYKRIQEVLAQLHSKYPTYNMGRHLETALSDYPNMWDIPDKEMLFALEKYQAELSLDESPTDIEKIIEDGLNLSQYLEGEDYENDY